jgi:bifunctional pyridoxal-dependent enzyme with beta-cystathionase and maltose regulon repressor activities
LIARFIYFTVCRTEAVAGPQFVINENLNRFKKRRKYFFDDFAMYLLYQAHIAVVPGSAFGKENYRRLSYATSKDYLHEAVFRLKKALKKLL